MSLLPPGSPLPQHDGLDAHEIAQLARSLNLSLTPQQISRLGASDEFQRMLMVELSARLARSPQPPLEAAAPHGDGATSSMPRVLPGLVHLEHLPSALFASSPLEQRSQLPPHHVQQPHT